MGEMSGNTHLKIYSFKENGVFSAKPFVFEEKLTILSMYPRKGVHGGTAPEAR